MPIPIIIGVAAGAAGLYGLYKGGKAIVDSSDADDINDEAESIVARSQELLEDSREKCKSSMMELGRKKVYAIQGNFKDFLVTIEKIKNVDFEHSDSIDNMSLAKFDRSILDGMRESVSFIESSGLGAGGGAVAGALTAFGAYSGTMAFAAASTGTAISTLSGAAATNATLAWLGGGSLASGGLGVAGGTMVLGALAAGPALLIAGWYMGSKAEAKLNDARSNRALAREFRENAQTAITMTDGIREVTETALNILSGLRKHSRRSLESLNKIIDTKGNDYELYSDEERMCVMRNIKIIQAIKALIETPILDEKGALLEDSGKRLEEIKMIADKVTIKPA